MARAEGVDSPTVWAAALAVVAASTLVHGTTAAPFRRLHERLDRDHGAAGPEAATAERRCAAPGPPAGTGMGGGE
jgi:hypothetical protein